MDSEAISSHLPRCHPCTGPYRQEWDGQCFSSGGMGDQPRDSTKRELGEQKKRELGEQKRARNEAGRIILIIRTTREIRTMILILELERKGEFWHHNKILG